jgi:hypothetical protein
VMESAAQADAPSSLMRLEYRERGSRAASSAAGATYAPALCRTWVLAGE